MAQIQRISSGNTDWGAESIKLNSNFNQLNENKVEVEEGSRLITEEEIKKLSELVPQVQSDLLETDPTSKAFIKGKTQFQEDMLQETDDKLILNNNEFITPTLERVPTSSTLTYTVGSHVYDFKIGQFARATVNGEVQIYQLYDITSGNNAVWKQANSGEGGGGGEIVGGYADGIVWFELQDPSTIIPLTDISLSRSSVSYLFKHGEITGDSTDIASLISFTPANASDKEVTYTSSNPDLVVTNGEVTKLPAAAGQYTITIKSIDGNYTEILTVNVANYIAIDSITVTQNSLTIDKSNMDLQDVLDGVYSLSTYVSISPEDATNKGIQYASDNPLVATINASTGAIRPVANGTCKLTATSVDDPTKTATMDLTVNTSIETVNIIQTELYFTELDKTSQLNLQLLPSDANIETNITWSSSDTSVATVDSEGLVTSKGYGNATITATNGKLSDTAAIKVSIPVTGIILTEAEKSLTQGNTAQLSFVIYPENATNKAVTWSSSDTSVATVNDTGLVTALNKVGSAIIKVKTVDGNHEATCNVSVIAP